MGGFSGFATPGGGGVTTEPIRGDSLTRFVRSLQNLTGQQGQEILGAGQGQFQQGIEATAPVLQFLTQLVKGDQGDVTQAAQPEIDQITQQFDQIRNMISMAPRGGGKATALAEAPFQKAGAIQRTEGELRKGAAAELSGLGTTLAGLGLEESGLGAGLETASQQAALTRRGQNVSQDISNLGNLTSGLETAFSALI